MKKLLSSENSILKGSAFTGSILASAVLLICCLIYFTGITWAWFSASTAVRTVKIVTANYENEVVVTDREGNVIEPVDGKYNLDSNVRYTVTINASGTASTGFATFSVAGNDYSSVQIAPGESISFDIHGYTPFEIGEANWGTSSSQDPVTDGDLRFVKSTVNFSANEGKFDGDEDTFEITANVNDEFGTVPEPARTGYTFSGWNTKDDGSGDAFEIPEKMPDVQEGTMTVYAKWTANKYTINYTTDGSAVDPDTLTYGTDDVPTKAATKAGYTFDNWYLEDTHETAYTPDWETVLANSVSKAGGEANDIHSDSDGHHD